VKGLQKNDIIERTTAFSMSGTKYLPFDVKSSPQNQTLPIVRGQFTCLLYANPGKVEFSADFKKISQVGKNSMDIQIISPSGKKIAITPAILGELNDYSFNAAEAGVYAISGNSFPNIVKLSSPKNRISLELRPDIFIPLNLYKAAEFAFVIPAGVKDFYVELQGSDYEGVKATLINPDGDVVNMQDNINFIFKLAATRDNSSKDEVWTLKLEAPSTKRFEDYCLIGIFGVPPALGASKESALMPSKL